MLNEFEDKYVDVLQNIEFELLEPVNRHRELCDHDMLRIIEQTIALYKTQQKGTLLFSQSKLSGIHEEIFRKVFSMCEWRLGRSTSLPMVPPITLEEIILRLKRIEKSIKFWTRNAGRTGYIEFAAPRALVSPLPLEK